jgi:hypothetical protein
MYTGAAVHAPYGARDPSAASRKANDDGAFRIGRMAGPPSKGVRRHQMFNQSWSTSYLPGTSSLYAGKPLFICCEIIQ